uniref:IncF plasmid conjugative transfer protein TraG n=1 Tax=Klebsiella pneumoniae TaxID=573 RepID=A0A8B0SU35_KLEPN|nr:IncF plasmid conjugative transfer protein TraG [Klebsiella pneumoniae]
MTSARNSLQQFGTNKGNSTSTTTGADTTESSQDSMARSKMWNAVVANAKANNISNEESFQQLMDDSSKKELNHLMHMYLVNGVLGISCLAS